MTTIRIRDLRIVKEEVIAYDTVTIYQTEEQEDIGLRIHMRNGSTFQVNGPKRMAEFMDKCMKYPGDKGESFIL